jgi:F-type H+-transporting ATPase subunit b
MEILNEFGVDWRLLLAQIINFSILLFVLKKILYKPILKMLEDRRERIAQAEKNAEDIEKRLEKIESEREKTIEKASSEAMKILEDATKTSSQIIEEAHTKASEDIQTMIAKAKMQIAQDHDKMREEIRSELADLVATAMTVVYEKKLTKSDQEEIIKSTLKNMR